jgi:FkbM family methyltransferase
VASVFTSNFIGSCLNYRRGLAYYLMQSFSQFGEDVLVWKYFKNRPDGFFVEIGANHPTKFSQTYLFEQQGWKGLLIEPLAEKCALLRQLRPGSTVAQAAAGSPRQRGRAKFSIASDDDMLSGLNVRHNVAVDHVVEVEVRTLDEVLAELGDPKIDFLSIDVEGGEMQVMEGFDIDRHRPAMMLVEDHLHSMTLHHYILRHGYKLVKRTGCNNWYVPKASRFKLNTFGEEFELRKEIWLDTPWRCLRGRVKRLFARKTA